jgi:hypothetical protein
MNDDNPTVRVSFAEVLLTCLKALEGLGLPHGLDHDTAANAAWLEARGLGGISILAREMERLGEANAWVMPEIEDDGAVVTIEAEATSGALLAPGAVDWALGGRLVTVMDCAAPMLIMAEAARRCAGAAALTVSWGIDRGKSTAKCGGGLAALSLDIRTARQPSSVTIRAGKSPSAKDGGRLAGFHAQSLRDGIAVDPADWAIIKHAAKRILVPASAQSRSGAGAEVDDSA